MSLLTVPDLHVSGRTSLTAQAVALWRAVEHDRPAPDRIVDDPFARLFLRPAGRVVRRPLDAGRPLLDATARVPAGGLATFVLCRHRFIDERLRTALDAGVEQVVLLGAGLDSRAYRLADALAGRPVFEVDLPALSRAKARLAERHRRVLGPTVVRRVEIDFRTQSLVERLDAARFVRGRATAVVWEGVVPYLSPEAVDATLSALRAVCGPGSVLALDLWDGAPGPGWGAVATRLASRTLGLIGEPVTFGIEPDDAGRLLRLHGFTPTSVLDARELTRAFATAGRRCAPSLYVLSARG